VKFSVRQIFASAAGAVLAAVIASLFGVKGTIVGVAIGSAAATFGTALVAQSIEQGHKAVKQVVVRVPDSSSLLRRMGGTKAAGVTESASSEPSTLAEETATTGAQSDDTTQMDAATAGTEAPVTEPVAATGAATTETAATGAATTETAATEAAATETVAATTMAMAMTAAADDTAQLPASGRPVISRRSIPWRAIAGTAAVVFVLALAIVTVVELIAGQPLSDLVGHHTTGNGPSVGDLFNNPPATTTTTTPSTTTSTSTTSTTTTSTTSTSTTTTTSTVPGSTTTTAPGSTTTTVGTGTSTTTAPTGG
jgi:hypothetical protein